MVFMVVNGKLNHKVDLVVVMGLVMEVVMEMVMVMELVHLRLVVGADEVEEEEGVLRRGPGSNLINLRNVFGAFLQTRMKFETTTFLKALTSYVNIFCFIAFVG